MKLAQTLFVIGTLICLLFFASTIKLHVKEINSLRMRVTNLETVINSQEVMSPRDFQKFLNEIEPKPELIIKEDGRIGQRTLAKWDRIFCNQSAAKTFFKKGIQ